MSSAISSFGGILKRNTNVVAELTSIGHPSIKLDTKEVTNHQSANYYREHVGTLLDGGEVPFAGNFLAGDTNGQIGLMTDQNARTLQAFTVTLPPAVTAEWAFNALVTAFELGEMTADGVQEFSGSLKVSGKPTLSLTASAGLTTPFFTVSGAGTLIVPAAATAVYDYVIDIATGVATVTITPTATAGVITITANGVSQVVVTGNPSTAITLGAAGSIVIAIVSVQETGKVAKNYTLRLTRAAA